MDFKQIALAMITGLWSWLAAAHTFMPENDLHLRFSLMNSDVTLQKFNEILDDAEEVYAPIIRNEFGRTLHINRLWSDPTVNASASQAGSAWILNMYGGLARAEPTTPDGFALVVCHELGHHLGGVAFYPGRWAASEGQSDYFATLACAKKIWGGDFVKNRESRDLISLDQDNLIAKNLCDQTYITENEQNLCYRIALASKSLATLLASIKGGEPRFEFPDERTVSTTFTPHPQPQCRLDTYLAGALCDVTWDDSLIPGKRFSNHYDLRAFIEAEPFACHSYDGSRSARPRCWFSPIDYEAPTISINKLTEQQTLARNDVWQTEPFEVRPGEAVTVDLRGTGDADLFVRFGEEPDLNHYDCAPFLYGSNETCATEVSTSTRLLYTMVRGWSSQSDVSISIGVNATAKLCHDYSGGFGDEFSCWEEFTCKLISLDSDDNQLNWCINY